MLVKEVVSSFLYNSEKTSASLRHAYCQMQLVFLSLLI